MGERALLAMDTCTHEGVLAVGRAGELLAEARFTTRKGATGSLMRLIDDRMGELGLGPSSLGLVAVGTGPGTFTGVKVGVATAKALALALGVPLLGISTLEILAAGVKADGRTVLATVEGGRGTLFAAFFRPGSRPPGISEYLRADAGALASMAAGYREGLLVVGAVDDALRGALDLAGLDYRVADGGIDPEAFVGLATGAAGGADPRGALTVQPVYLRGPV